MNESSTRSHMKLWVALAAVLLAVACCFAVTPKAYASGVDWNNSVTVDATANPYDATASGTERNQTINVVMTFSAALPSSISSDDAQSYLQSHTTIAGRALSGTYNRAITNVSVNRNEIAFTVGPNTAGMTAIYSGEFKVTADADANSAFASAMGGQPVETLINTGLGLTVINSSDQKTATIVVSSLPKCRAMNFFLLSDGSDYMFTNGSSADGNGLTIHSHMFFQQTAANYAAEIVNAANNAGAADLGYTFQVENGNVKIAKTDGSAMSGINAVIYDGNYLNQNRLAVGTTTEQPMQN